MSIGGAPKANRITKMVNVIPGTTESIKQFLGKVPVFLKVVSPTCVHCNNMKNAWSDLRWEGLPSDLVLASVDFTKAKELPHDVRDLLNKGVPAIALIKPNSSGKPQVIEYEQEERTAKAMADFVKSELGRRGQSGGRTRRRTKAECSKNPGPGCRWHHRRRIRANTKRTKAKARRTRAKARRTKTKARRTRVQAKGTRARR